MLTHKPMAAKLHFGLLGWEETSGVVPRHIEFLFSLKHCGIFTDQAHPTLCFGRTPQWLSEQWLLPKRPKLSSCAQLFRAAALTALRSIIMGASCSHFFHLQLTSANHSTEKLKDLALLSPVATVWAPTQNQEANVSGSIEIPHHQLATFFPGTQPCRANPPVLYKWNSICGAASGLHLHME